MIIQTFKRRWKDLIYCHLIKSFFLIKPNWCTKFTINVAPVYLHELFQMRDINLDNTASNLRSVANQNFLLPQAKCNWYKGSFTYSGVVVWNSLPDSIKLASSLNSFVQNCTEWLKNVTWHYKYSKLQVYRTCN